MCLAVTFTVPHEQDTNIVLSNPQSKSLHRTSARDYNKISMLGSIAWSAERCDVRKRVEDRTFFGR